MTFPISEAISIVEFVTHDAEELEFDDESFDAVLSRATLMFLPDVVGTLKRLHGFLKPAGRPAASVWGRQGEDRPARTAPTPSGRLWGVRAPRTFDVFRPSHSTGKHGWRGAPGGRGLMQWPP